MADTKPQFTPGPWELKRTKARIEVITSGLATYAFSHADEANASLIAAAPELYAALQACDDAGLFDRDDAISTSARAALAKARGEK